jgi:sodium transport system permease protein
MNLKKITAVYKKELKDTLRDKRTILMMVLVPIVMYPVLFILMNQIQSAGLAKLELEKSRIAIKSAAPVYLDSLLKNDDKLFMVCSEDPMADLKNGSIQGIVDIKTMTIEKSSAIPDSILIYYDGAVERSQMANSRTTKLVEQYKRQSQKDNVSQAGLDTAILEPFGWRSGNIAPPSRMGGRILGFLIPLFLVITILMGAMYPAIDLTAGEKERGTLETILTAPVAKMDLFMGKYLTVSTIAIITGILNLVSMMMTFGLGFIQLGVISGKMDFSLSPLTLVLILFMIIPLALFIGAVLLSVSLFARSFKDAQNIITPVYLALMMPTFIALSPGIQLNGFLALVPVANITLLFKDLLLNTFSAENIFLVFLSNCVFALLGIMTVSRLFGSEQVLMAEGKGLQFSFKRSRIRPVDVLPPSTAVIICTVIMILLFYVAGVLQLRMNHWGIAITEWGLIFLPVLLALWYFKANYRMSLHLRGFNFGAGLGAILLYIGSMGLANWVDLMQAKVFPESVKALEPLQKMLDVNALGISPWLGVFLFGLGPGICEELLFRGMLLSSFRKKMAPAAAIVAVALLFGIFHMSIFRFVPTFLLGIYFTYVVYRTGSIYLSILAHTLNNSLAVLLIYSPTLASKFMWLTGEKPFPPQAIAVMTGLVILGVFCIHHSTKLTDRK